MCCVPRQRSTYGNAYDGDGDGVVDDDDNDDDDVLLCMHNIHKLVLLCVYGVCGIKRRTKQNKTKAKI